MASWPKEGAGKASNFMLSEKCLKNFFLVDKFCPKMQNFVLILPIIRKAEDI